MHLMRVVHLVSHIHTHISSAISTYMYICTWELWNFTNDIIFYGSLCRYCCFVRFLNFSLLCFALHINRKLPKHLVHLHKNEHQHVIRKKNNKNNGLPFYIFKLTAQNEIRTRFYFPLCFSPRGSTAAAAAAAHSVLFCFCQKVLLPDFYHIYSLLFSAIFLVCVVIRVIYEFTLSRR